MTSTTVAPKILGVRLLAALAALVLTACHAQSEACKGLDVPTPQPEAIAKRAEERTGTMVTAPHAIAAASSPLSARIAFSVLRKGGSAVDAFIAASLADDVVLPGQTSIAGLQGILLYSAPTQAGSTAGRRLEYLHGPFATPASPAAVYRDGDTALGKQVLIPGEVAALEQAWLSYGKLKWEDDVLPVAQLAREGFPIDDAYAKAIAERARQLQSTDYGKATFFKDGKPLPAGARLKQPQLADTLEQLAHHGASHLYKGDWAKQLVQAVKAKGGAIELFDLAGYQPLSSEPLHGAYHELDVATSSGLSSGGAKLLLSLATLDHFDLARLGRREGSARALEVLIDVQRAVEDERFLRDPEELKDRARLERTIAVAAFNIARQVTGKEAARTPYDPKAGTHSAHVIVVDADGNIATGTHTMEAPPWGEGFFVGGVALATSAPYVAGVLKPNSRLLDPLSTEIVFQEGQPRLVLGTYGTGLSPADVEVLSGLADYGLNPEQAVLEPRLGWFAVNPLSRHPDPTVNLLDPRVPRDVVCELLRRGVEVRQRDESAPDGLLDLGYPMVVKLNTGKVQAMVPELSGGEAVGY